MGVISPDWQKMDASCCDVFQRKNGTVQTFSCHPSATVILEQLGVLPNLQTSLHGGTQGHLTTPFGYATVRRTCRAPLGSSASASGARSRARGPAA
jgi:hypothetical protein